MGDISTDALKFYESTIHTFEYASYQYEFSKNYTNSNGFDAVEFSLGFGSHLAQDLVGHYSTYSLKIRK